MTITHLITVDDLEAMGSDTRFELIRGVLHEMSPSYTDSSVIAMRLAVKLGAHIEHYRLGILSGEGGGYLVERDPDTVVAPDLGFITRERLALWPSRKGYFPACPDLIVEVVSASDERSEIRRKQELYDRIGVPMIWWIDPKRRTATVDVPGQPTQHLSENDTLDGGSIVPGFSIHLGSLFDF